MIRKEIYITFVYLWHLPFTRKGKVGCEALSFLWECGLFGNDPKHVHVHGHSHDSEQLLQMLMQKKTHSEGTDEVNTTYANNDNRRQVAKDPDASQGSLGFPVPACARVSLPLNGIRRSVVPFDPEPRSQTRRIQRLSKMIVVACRQCISIFDDIICRFVSIQKIIKTY